MKKRVGILTYFGSINNGAFLQAFSLQEFLKVRFSDYANIEMINYESKYASDYFISRTDDLVMKDNYEMFVRNRSVFDFSDKQLISDDLNCVARYLNELQYDVIIVGSDEVWKTDGMRGFPNAFWLNFDIGNSIRAAYAVSGRNNYSVHNEQEKDYIRSAVEKFAYIGTRDQITENEIYKICPINIHRNCDPVFLNKNLFEINKFEINKIKQRRGIAENKKLVTVIVSLPNLATQLHTLLYEEFIVVDTYSVSDRNTDYDCFCQSPFEWQELIAISDYVITSLFHATVFSLIHNINFISIENSPDGRGKIEAILSEYNLENRCIRSSPYRGDAARLGEEVYKKLLMLSQQELNDNFDNVVRNEKKKADSFIDFLGNCLID